VFPLIRVSSEDCTLEQHPLRCRNAFTSALQLDKEVSASVQPISSRPDVCVCVCYPLTFPSARSSLFPSPKSCMPLPPTPSPVPNATYRNRTLTAKIKIVIVMYTHADVGRAVVPSEILRPRFLSCFLGFCCVLYCTVLYPSAISQFSALYPRLQTLILPSHCWSPVSGLYLDPVIKGRPLLPVRAILLSRVVPFHVQCRVVSHTHHA